jgi:hypothetical protein
MKGRDFDLIEGDIMATTLGLQRKTTITLCFDSRFAGHDSKMSEE